MKALILCAGYGTRLRPLTNNIPKPLVTVMGIPILEYIINLLAESGIKDIYINRHHLPEQFENINIPKEVNITFSYEKDILGTAGGILSFEKELDEDFLVVNGDVIFNLDIRELISVHKKSKKIATMVLRERDVKDATPVFRDDFSNVASIGGEGNGLYQELMFSGIHVMSPEIFKLTKKSSPPSCIVRNFYIPYIQSGGKVGSYVMDDKKGCFWKEIGDLNKYLDCNIWMIRSVSENKLKGFYELFVNEYWESGSSDDVVEEVVEGIWLGTDIEIDPSATLVQPVFIGSETTIGPEAVIGPNAIIGRNVNISNNSIVKDSVILDDTDIDECSINNKSVVSKYFKHQA